MNETPWYKNRKFVTPIIAAIATLLTTIAVSVWPEFPFSDQMVLQFLTWIWAAGLGIPAADAVYDQLGRVAEITRIRYDPKA